MIEQPALHDYDFLIGTNAQTGEEIWLGPKAYALGGYLLGVRRAGKSTMLLNLITQSIKKGYGVCLIDPHGDLLQQVINRIPKHRMSDVILLDPKEYEYPFGLNIYHCTDKTNPLAVEYTVNLVMHLFKKLWPSEYAQPLVEDVIRNTAYTILANDMTMTEISRLLFDPDFRRRMLANETNDEVRLFWKSYDNLKQVEQEQWGGVVGRRVRQFTASGIIRYIVGQREQKLNFRDIIDKRRILLVRLYAESTMSQLTSLIGSVIIGQLLQAAMSRNDTDARPEFHLYCDEYSEFATDDFATIIAQCGKYNLIPFIAHQSTGQINEQNQDSVIQLGSLFMFRLIGRDAEKLAREFNSDPMRQKTIPRYVLNHLRDHPHDIVKEFWRRYISPLDQALGKQERYEHDSYMTISGDRVRTEEIIYPALDFGAGIKVKYDRDDVMEARSALNDLLYEAMRGKLGKEELTKHFRRVIYSMAGLLAFVDYYNFHYAGETSLFLPSPSRKDIAEYERLKEMVPSFLASDIDLMRFFKTTQDEKHYDGNEYSYKQDKKLFHGYTIIHWQQDREALPRRLTTYKQKDAEECRRYFLEKVAEYHRRAPRYQSIHTYLAYLIAGYQEIYTNVTSTWLFNRNAPGFNPYKDRRDFEHLYALDYRKSPVLPGWDTWLFSRWSIIETVRQELLERLRFSIDDSRIAENRPFHLYCSLEEAEEGLSSEKAFVQLLVEHMPDYERARLFGGYRHVTPEELWQRLTEECQEKYAFYEPRNTPEKLLAATRHHIETEIAEIDAKLAPMYAQRDREVEDRRNVLDQQKEREQTRHDNFLNPLFETVQILMQPEYRIEVQSPTPAMSQTVADRRDQIANELRGLSPRTAKVRLPTGEFTITTITDTTSFQDQAGKRKRLLAQTRDRYCRSRFEVEEQIRQQQEIGIPTTTKRTHTL